MALRTAELQPPVLRERDGYDLLIHLTGNPAALATAVSFVCQGRSEELRRKNISPLPSADLAGGRILCTDLNTDVCASAEPASNGYFDTYDIPAWDTWFHFRIGAQRFGYIYCWVAPQLVDLVTAGADTIPTQSAWWIDSLDELDA